MRAFAPVFLLLAVFLILGCAGQQPSAQTPSQEQPALPVQEQLQEQTGHIVLPPPQNNSPTQQGNNSSIPLPSNNSTSANGSLSNLPSAYFYYSPYCGYCRMIEPMVNATAKKYEGKVQLVRVDVFTNEGYAAFDRMTRERNLSNSSRVVPLIVYGSRILVGYQEISQSLDSLLASASEG